jgi:uroporphyrin-III C-methyltransferase/precorrin-2 dehydrogenase/sirohydrochlorin ferrochelatase
MAGPAQLPVSSASATLTLRPPVAFRTTRGSISCPPVSRDQAVSTRAFFSAVASAGSGQFCGRSCARAAWAWSRPAVIVRPGASDSPRASNSCRNRVPWPHLVPCGSPRLTDRRERRPVPDVPPSPPAPAVDTVLGHSSIRKVPLVTYLVGLDLRGRPVLVVGAGRLAARQVPALLDAGAKVTLVAPEATPTLEGLALQGTLRWERRTYADADLDDTWFVLAATGRPDVDAAVAADAERCRLFCLQAEQQDDDPTAGAGSASQRPGRVALVGAGPGADGLITVRGQRLLADADVVLADRLVPQNLLADLPGHVLVVDAAKNPNGPAMSQETINALLVEHARAGRRVVRLKGGDPYVFGRGSEELEACLEAGVECDVVPGVSSAFAGPAVAGVPVTHRGVAHEIVVVSGHRPPGHPESQVDWTAIGRLRGTVVLLMAVATFPEIARTLVEAGRPPDTPVLVVQRAYAPDQDVLVTTLAEAPDLFRWTPVSPPAVITVGRVVERAALQVYARGTGLPEPARPEQ